MLTPNPTPHTPDTKNLIIALVLGTLIMAGWQYFYERPRALEREALAQQQAEAQKKAAPAVAAAPHDTAVAEDTTTPSVAPSKSRDAVLADQSAKRIPIRSDALHGSLSLVGGRIDDLTLAEFRETQDKNSPEVVLLSPSQSAQSYFAEFGWLPSEEAGEFPSNTTVWKSDADALTPEKPVTLSWTNDNGVEFRKTIAMDKDYLFTVTMSVKNAGKKAITLYPYGIIQRNYDDASKKHFAILHEGPLAVFNNTLTDVDYKKLREDGAQQFDKVQGWLGITDKYWLAAMVPDAAHPFNANMKHVTRAGVDAYQVDYRAEAVTVAAGDTQSITNHLFAGAKKVNVLDRYRDEKGFALFDRAVDFGMFYFLTKPIFYALDFIYGYVGNFGIAILVLTVFIKLLMYPLANKSYTAMSQMKLLMPKIKELQEKFADDKMKMNSAMMELYKREKVNPMSGCLPILLQIPVFFSLYKVLFVTLEMRHAPFFGWIQDLSAKDPTNLFNLFGVLQWTPPSMLHVGVWPLIMCLTMVIQQKLNPKPTDPVQAVVISYMPYMFLFLFASFPAGLVVYWAWNNLLSIIQQRYIQYKLEHKTAAKARG